MTEPLPLDRTALVTRLVSALSPALRESLGNGAADAARAIASGAALPSTVEAESARPLLSLVAFDADRIQSWVFASERIQVAAGASATLDLLNQGIDAVVDDVDGLTGVLFSAGGGGLLVGPPTYDLGRLADRVRTSLESRSRGLTFTVHALTAAAPDLAPSAPPTPLAGSAVLGRFERLTGVAGLLNRLQAEIRRRKEETAPSDAPTLSRHTGIVAERCPSCGLRPPGRRPVTDDGPAFWCDRCRELRDSWKSGRGRELERDGRPLTFEDLVEASHRGRRFLGFVAIDGNSMGRLFRRVGTLLKLRALSEVTTHVYAEARARVPQLLTGGGFLGDDWVADEAFLSLLSGGDEITLVLPASAAPSIASDLLRAVESGFDEAAAPGGLIGEVFSADPDLLGLVRAAGASAGVVTAPGSYPVRLLRRYASTLLSGAKRAAAAQGRRSTLAWHLLTDSSPLAQEIEIARDAETSLDAFDRLLAETAAATAHRVPRSALQRLLAEAARETQTLRSLPTAERQDTAARCAANFLRYQIARNAALAAWWSEVGPSWTASDPQGAGDDADGALPWMRAGVKGRLQRLVDLLSLDPVPDRHQTSSEAA